MHFNSFFIIPQIIRPFSFCTDHVPVPWVTYVKGSTVVLFLCIDIAMHTK